MRINAYRLGVLMSGAFVFNPEVVIIIIRNAALAELLSLVKQFSIEVRFILVILRTIFPFWDVSQYMQ
tara:strand:+ start:512 stop:715 length:204 start_codon:yes stop_codon:yes gene_type:complete